MSICDIWNLLRYKPAPDNPRDYWNPAEVSAEDEKKLLSIAIDDTGQAYGYNPARQANPAWRGNNKSRSGMLYNPYFHPLGKFMQGTIKGSLIKCVNFAHAAILTYDTKAYRYEDLRLQRLEQVAKAGIEELFFDELERRSHNDGRRKIEFMQKAVDITLFLMKEDIAYRWRLILLLKWVGKLVEHFEPTPEELANLKALKR